MRSRPAAALASCLVLAGAVACATVSGPAPSPAGAAAATPPVAAHGTARAEHALRVFATGETRGHLKPCKCEEGQFGGLERRAGYLAGAAHPRDLLIDLGNSAAGAGAVRDLRLATTLRALAAMGYRVFVPGELEAVIADTLLRESARHEGLTVVTANLVRGDGRPAFASHVLVPLGDGRTMAIVGLTQSVRPLPPGWRFEPARVSLERALDEIGGAADAVLVASSLDVADTRAMIADLPSVAVALSSSDSREPPEDLGFAFEDLDPTARHVGVVANFSTYVRVVELGPELRATRTWRAWLGEDVPGLSAASALVRAHRERAVDLSPTLVPDILSAQRAAGLVGSAVCAECHAEEHAAWEASGHAHAMRTLVREEAARDPDCVSCHLVDVPGRPDEPRVETFTAAMGDDLGVGCEACHGPRGKHVETAMLGVVPPGGGPTWPARSVCTRCHRPPEVRRFDFESAWPRIAHGERAPR